MKRESSYFATLNTSAWLADITRMRREGHHHWAACYELSLAKAIMEARRASVGYWERVRGLIERERLKLKGYVDEQTNI
jgi:hypothetical protein